MPKTTYAVDCEKIIIGTAPGSSKDAKDIVEAQIERYFDIPKRCQYTLRKHPDYGFHYEIQEEPQSGSVLKEIINKMGEEDAEVTLIDNNGNQCRIFKRQDGSLRTFFLAESESASTDNQSDLPVLKGKRGAFKPYFSTLAVGSVLSGILFLASTALLGGSLAVSATQKAIDSGYQYAAKNSPMSALFDSGFDPRTRSLVFTDPKLMSEGWNSLIAFQKESGADQQVGMLVYADKNWAVIPKK